MKTLEDQMSFCAAYHQDARNKATHFVGVLMLDVAPVFLAAEVFSALGYKPGLHEEVQRRAMRLRAQAGVDSADSSLKSA